MKRIVGYLINHPDGLKGEPGMAYDYILAGNGLFVRAEKLGPGGIPLIRATVPVAEAEVRGLAGMETQLELPQGKVPGYLWTVAFNAARRHLPDELYASIVWGENGYRLAVAQQETTPGSIRYTPESDTLVDIHSHGAMRAFFSSTDDADDVGFRVSVVIGHLDRPVSDVVARVSVYGYKAPAYVGDIFR